MTTDREMSLDEWCGILPNSHKAVMELKELKRQLEAEQESVNDLSLYTQDLVRALTQSLICIKAIHPFHNESEPCIAFETVKLINEVMGKGENIMKAWQIRVIEEERDLSQKIDSLFAFVENYSDSIPEVSPENMRLLRLQGAVMSLYRQILRERIDDFSK